MELWVRIALVAAAGVGGFVLGMLVTKPVLQAMIRAAGRSVGRALLVVFGYYTAMIVLAGVFGMVAAVLYPRWFAGRNGGRDVPRPPGNLTLRLPSDVIGLCADRDAATHLAPQAHAPGRRSEGCPRYRLAWCGVVFSLVPGLVIMFVFALVPLAIGR